METKLNDKKFYMVTKDFIGETVMGLVHHSGVMPYPYEFVGDDGRTHTFATMEDAAGYASNIEEVDGVTAHAWKMQYNKNWRHGGYKGSNTSKGFVTVKQAEEALGADLVKNIHELVRR